MGVMGKLVSRTVSRSFRLHDELFAGLDARALAALTAGNSDIAVLLAPDGVVLDIAYRDESLAAWDIDGWIGRPFHDSVRPDSREKIDELLGEAETATTTRSRQVNHPASAGRDLPVGYRIVSVAQSPYRIAFGTDLREMADMQQRLVLAQIEMEKDYRKLRDIESRYRMLFHLAVEPLIVVDAQSLRILDANEGAAQVLGRPVEKLVGSLVNGLFAKADQTSAIQTFKAIEARARPDSFKAKRALSDREMTLRVTPFREHGRTNLLVRLSEDDAISAERIAPPDDHMASVIESLPEGLVVVDDKGRIVQANPAFLDLIRVVTLDRVEGRGLDNWLGGSSVDLQVLLANLREHGIMRRFSSVIRDELGGSETVEVSAAKVAVRDGWLFGFSIREAPRPEVSRTAMAPRANGANGGSSHLTDLVGRVPLKDLVRDSSDIIEKLCIEAALRLTDNNRASAADMLGLSRQSLYIKLRRYGISDMETEAEER